MSGQRPNPVARAAPRKARLSRLKGRLVDDWTFAWRWWSARMMALAIVLQIVPAEAFLTIYAMVPPDIQMLLPSRTLLVVTCSILALIGRVWKQEPKKGKRHDQ